MSIVKAKCPKCGAILDIDDEKDATICSACKEAFITEIAISNYKEREEKAQNISTNLNVEAATGNIGIKIGGYTFDDVIASRIIDCINRGEKTAAIKYVKESTGLDLVEAKAIVDNYIKENSVTYNQKATNTNSSTTVTNANSSSTGVICCIIIVIFLFVMML